MLGGSIPGGYSDVGGGNGGSPSSTPSPPAEISGLTGIPGDGKIVSLLWFLFQHHPDHRAS